MDAFGVDPVTLACWRKPRRLNPGLQFLYSFDACARVAFRDAGRGGCVSTRLFILRDRKVVEALAEVRRVLHQPGGLFLFTFHLGREDGHHEELFGRPVNLDIALLLTRRNARVLEGRGVYCRAGSWARPVFARTDVNTKAVVGTFWLRVLKDESM